MTATPVDAKQRFNRNRPCPVCAGHQQLQQGRGTRCSGFLSGDGDYVHCSREEHATNIAPGKDGLYAHRLHGDCRCGVQHGEAKPHGTYETNVPNRVAPRGAKLSTTSSPRGENVAKADKVATRGAPFQQTRWEIRDVGGEHIATHVRIDRDGGKRYAWELPDGTLGLGGIRTDSLPLYGADKLAELADGARIVVCEGEKSADSLLARGVPAVGVVTGAPKIPAKGPLQPLLRLSPILWPDNDDPGAALMKGIGSLLVEMGATPPPVVNWTDAPPKGDAADFSGTLDELDALLDNASGFTHATDESRVTVDSFPVTEQEVSELFAETHEADVCYLPDLKEWRVFNGQRWVRDALGAVQTMYMDLVRELRVQAAEIEDTDARKAAFRFAFKLETSSLRHHVLDGAGWLLAKSADVFDADPWLFNCANGTLHLRTGELRPHNRADMLSKLAPVAYYPEAKDGRFDRFLGQTFDGDLDLIDFLKRWFGYSLTGDVSEEKIAFHHGAGATGKSTLMDAVRSVYGDYAATANFALFLAKDFTSTGPSPELARLVGVRALFSIETDEGKRLAEGLLKMVSGGGEPIAAAFKYKDEFEFVPQFKLNLVANHAPVVRADDDAIWRRILRIPFDRVVPEEDRDPDLKRAFRTDKDLQQAVLAWLVEGCAEWLRDGLGVPATVKDATNVYRDEQDDLSAFIEAECELDPEAIVPVPVLWGAWQQFANQNGADLRTKNALSRALSRLGITTERIRIGGKQQRAFVGITLTEASKPPENRESVTHSAPVTHFSGKPGKSHTRARTKEFPENGAKCVTNEEMRHTPDDWGGTDDGAWAGFGINGGAK